jgi:formyltetrahydrofolate synthetase
VQRALSPPLLLHLCSYACLRRSNDPAAKGAPSGFTFKVRELRVAAGAGWVIAICGDMNMIPGLPTRPAYYEIDLDPATGRVLGLS